MNLVDVHCHLNQERFLPILDDVLKRAKEAGVKAIVVSGTNPKANKQVLEMTKIDPIIKASFGMHPIDAIGLSEGETGIPKQEGKVDLDKEFKFIEDNKDKIVAIGEVGLDYHWDKEHHKEQQEVFRKIIQFAIKINKPLILHTWDAEEDAINIMEEENKNKVPVILHCFAGRKSLVTRAIELGYYFSIPPSTVRTSNFNTMIKKVPITQLLTETDAPWQSLFKDKINEPAYVLETVKKIAEIKSLTVEETAKQIWGNYGRVFNQI